MTVDPIQLTTKIKHHNLFELIRNRMDQTVPVLFQAPIDLFPVSHFLWNFHFLSRFQYISQNAIYFIFAF